MRCETKIPLPAPKIQNIPGWHTSALHVFNESVEHSTSTYGEFNNFL